MKAGLSREILYFNRKTIACPCELLNSSPGHCLWSIIYLSVSKIILLPTCTFYMNCQFLSNLNFLQLPSISDSRSTDWCFQIFSHSPDLASLRTKICPDLYWDSVVFHSLQKHPGLFITSPNNPVKQLKWRCCISTGILRLWKDL